MQGSPTVYILRIDVCSLFDEQCGDFRMTFTRCKVQGSPAFGITRGQVGTLGDE